MVSKMSLVRYLSVLSLLQHMNSNDCKTSTVTAVALCGCCSSNESEEQAVQPTETKVQCTTSSTDSEIGNHGFLRKKPPHNEKVLTTTADGGNTTDNSATGAQGNGSSPNGTATGDAGIPTAEGDDAHTTEDDGTHTTADQDVVEAQTTADQEDPTHIIDHIGSDFVDELPTLTQPREILVNRRKASEDFKAAVEENLVPFLNWYVFTALKEKYGDEYSTAPAPISPENDHAKNERTRKYTDNQIVENIKSILVAGAFDIRAQMQKPFLLKETLQGKCERQCQSGSAEETTYGDNFPYEDSIGIRFSLKDVLSNFVHTAPANAVSWNVIGARLTRYFDRYDVSETDGAIMWDENFDRSELFVNRLFQMFKHRVLPYRNQGLLKDINDQKGTFYQCGTLEGLLSSHMVNAGRSSTNVAVAPAADTVQIRQMVNQYEVSSLLRETSSMYPNARIADLNGRYFSHLNEVAPNSSIPDMEYLIFNPNVQYLVNNYFHQRQVSQSGEVTFRDEKFRKAVEKAERDYSSSNFHLTSAMNNVVSSHTELFHLGTTKITSMIDVRNDEEFAKDFVVIQNNVEGHSTLVVHILGTPDLGVAGTVNSKQVLATLLVNSWTSDEYFKGLGSKLAYRDSSVQFIKENEDELAHLGSSQEARDEVYHAVSKTAKENLIFNIDDDEASEYEDYYDGYEYAHYDGEFARKIPFLEASQNLQMSGEGDSNCAIYSANLGLGLVRMLDENEEIRYRSIELARALNKMRIEEHQNTILRTTPREVGETSSAYHARMQEIREQRNEIRQQLEEELSSIFKTKVQAFLPQYFEEMHTYADTGVQFERISTGAFERYPLDQVKLYHMNFRWNVGSDQFREFNESIHAGLHTAEA